ncbi:hypothetical protein HII31_11868 [Pseudocercospora fuligena]|uniref:Uncharacterized protein n=1 Tax=Pseudocercospora fuligena TaxID=685502 RepID=A0A8H6RB38_9PEZI|nr:hypothetical protein HII31_11868 [Pseudocercospora fuligena]
MPGQSKTSRLSSKHIWIDGGKVHREDGPDEKEVVPDWEQAGSWFPPDTSSNCAMQAELEAAQRTESPVELPTTPAQPPRYEDIETAGKKPLDADKQGGPMKADGPSSRAEVMSSIEHKRPRPLKISSEQPESQGDRPATPMDEEQNSAKDTAQNNSNKLRGGGNDDGRDLDAIQSRCKPVKKASPKHGSKPSNALLVLAGLKPIVGSDRAVRNRW